MPADDPPNQTYMGQMIQPAISTIPLAGGIQQSQTLRFSARKKPPFQSTGEGFRMSRPHESPHRNAVAIPDLAHGLIGRAQQLFRPVCHEVPVLDVSITPQFKIDVTLVRSRCTT
jgi:hypothetical protein